MRRDRRWFRGFILLAVVLGAVLGVSPALAKPEVTRQTFVEIVDGTLLSECLAAPPEALACLGEDMALSGKIEHQTTITIDQNGFRFNELIVDRGLRGVGLTTGKTYRAFGFTNNRLNQI